MKDLKSVKTDVWDVRLGSTLRKIFRQFFFSLKATWLCLNRVCHASNSIPSEFGANRSWSLILVKTDVWDVCLGSRHLENFSPKIFFLKFTRLCLNRVCHALNSICSEFEPNRSWSVIFQSTTYGLDVCLGSRHLENFSSKNFFSQIDWAMS